MDSLVISELDIWPLCLPDGVTVQPNDVDSEKSGRITLDATMFRSIVAEKEKIVAKLTVLSQAEMQRIMVACHGAFVPVSYDSPRYGRRDGIMFYATIAPATACPPYRLRNGRGLAAWKGLEITLVER